MKSYTNIKQSKKLEEILLPIESADMCYEFDFDLSMNTKWKSAPIIIEERNHFQLYQQDIPCWSLAALLNVLPKVINNETLFIETSSALWHIGYRNVYTARADNLVDACYEVILKLHELKKL